MQKKLLRREEIAHSALHAAIDVALDVLNAIDGEVIPIRAGFVPQEVIAERLVEAAILRVNAERPRGSERFAIDPPASRKPVFDRSRSARFRQLRRLSKPQIGLAADGRFEDKQRFAVATGAVVRLPIRHAVKPVSFDESVNHALNGFDQVFADFADELRGLCGETEALPEGVIRECGERADAAGRFARKEVADGTNLREIVFRAEDRGVFAAGSVAAPVDGERRDGAKRLIGIEVPQFAKVDPVAPRLADLLRRRGLRGCGEAANGRHIDGRARYGGRGECGLGNAHAVQIPA